MGWGLELEAPSRWRQEGLGAELQSPSALGLATFRDLPVPVHYKNNPFLGKFQVTFSA